MGLNVNILLTSVYNGLDHKRMLKAGIDVKAMVKAGIDPIHLLTGGLRSMDTKSTQVLIKFLKNDFNLIVIQRN